MADTLNSTIAPSSIDLSSLSTSELVAIYDGLRQAAWAYTNALNRPAITEGTAAARSHLLTLREELEPKMHAVVCALCASNDIDVEARRVRHDWCYYTGYMPDMPDEGGWIKMDREIVDPRIGLS
jgi:nitroreductase